jgi:NAD(P)-dependent dehydrogenase (short-subunit alcohol dehydrogenase family)
MDQPVIIVTGASRGVGRATVEALHELGAATVAVARTSDALALLSERFDDCLAIPADLASDADREHIVERTLHRFGTVHGIVHNAAALEPLGPIGAVTADEWTAALTVNLIAPSHLTNALLEPLRRNHGRVVNVSSGAALSPIEGAGVYSATKAALKMWTESMAAEEPDLTTVALRPGVVDTAMQETIRSTGQGRLPDDWYQRFIGYHEDGRLLSPDLPGRAAALLVLRAPKELSGEHLSWDDERVQALG